MRRLWAVGAALAITTGCGGRQMLDQPPVDAMTNSGAPGATGAAGTGSSVLPIVGPIDLTQAPATFSMSCDHGVGTVTFDNPCLVGGSFSGAGDDLSPGGHEVECTLATASGAVGWSFLVIFPPTQNPQTVLPLTPTAVGGDVGNGQRASVSKFEGALTFSRVDPANRAFVARFTGTVTWTESTGTSFSCTIDAPLWGARGGFT